MRKRQSVQDQANRRWDIVRSRKTASDFVYAVGTTGVFCRPGCPSRRPRRENVTFFDTPQGARRAGYRPCKRCEPESANRGRHTEAVETACRMIEDAQSPPSLQALASAVGYTPAHFQRVFKSVLGVSPREYAAMKRGEQIRVAVHSTATTTDAVRATGHTSSASFYDEAGDVLGMTPTMYRAGGKGQTIYVSVMETYLGQTMIAATARGLCALEFGESDQRLMRLRDRFPHAEIVMDADFSGWMTEAVRVLERPDGSAALPVDVQGTAFQRRVWDALRTIPAGTTWSYRQVAECIGEPHAARAVARACAANPLAVIIPCHRVIRSDGSLGGYRWGVDTKRTLLERETASPVT